MNKLPPAKRVEVLFMLCEGSNRLKLVGQIDRGEITQEEAALRDANTKRELVDTALSRRNAAVAATPLPPMTPAPIQFAPQQTTCNRFGNTVSCNTY